MAHDIIDPDIRRKARWQITPTGYALRSAGITLAVIRRIDNPPGSYRRWHFRWDANGQSGTTDWHNDAQRAARAALRKI